MTKKADAARSKRLLAKLARYVVIFFAGLLAAMLVAVRNDEALHRVVSEKVLEWEVRSGAELTVLKEIFNVRLKANSQSLFEAIKDGDYVAVQTLLDAGVPRNSVDEKGRGPARAAVESSKPDILRLLISKDAEYSAPDKGGNTPLAAAVIKQDIDTAQTLISVRADVNRPISTGDTPLILAVRSQNVPMVDILLGAKVNVNASGAAGRTALMEAIEQSHIALAKKLIAAGANVNARDEGGNTPVIYAVKQQSLQIVAVLLEADVSVTLKNKEGKSAFDYAQEIGGTVAVVFSRVSDPSAVTTVSGTPPPPPVAQPTAASVAVRKDPSGTFSIVGSMDSGNEEPEASPEPTRVPMTRIRIVGEIAGEWERDKQLTLRSITIRIRNAGDSRAEGIQVRALVPGGEWKNLSGPEALDRNQVAEYFVRVGDPVTKMGNIKAELRCSNCYR